MSSLLEKAVRIATLAHEGQRRKEADIPYVSHPVSVAFKLLSHGFSETVVAAGLVHDVLEDTEYPQAQLQENLGDEVLTIVLAVTNDDALSWEEKKLRYIETVRNGPEGAKAVAIADKIHNAESLLNAYVEVGPQVWKNFNRGKEKKMWFEHEMLAMIKEVWTHPMIAEYELLVEQMDALPDV